MSTVTFQNGKTVNFEGTPSPQDIDFVAKQMGIGQQAQPSAPLTQADIPAMQGYNKYREGVSQASDAADQQIASGFDEFKGTMNPLKMLEGSLTGAAGLVNKVTSPLAPVFAPLGKAVNAVGDAVSNIPAVQQFAQTPVGGEVAQGAQDVQNLTTVAGGVAGAEKLPEVMSPKPEAEFTGPTVPFEPLPPKTPPLSPEAQGIVSKRASALQQIESGNGPVRKVSNYATSNGVDVKSLVSNTDLLHDSVDENGAINTTHKGGAIDQFNQFMDKYERAISDGLVREGRSIPMADVENAMMDQVNSSHIVGGSKTRLVNMVRQEIEGLRLDADSNGNIPLAKLQDAKISTTNGIDYTNPESKINAKMVAGTYKTLIEDNSSLPVKAVNGELARYYTIEDYLEALDGKRVKGGKLGTYFAQTVGGIAGSHFGPLGTIIGAELAGRIKGSILANTFGDEIGRGMQSSDLMNSQVQQNSFPRMGLPAPVEGSPRSSIGSGPSIPLMPQSMPESTATFAAPGGSQKGIPIEMMPGEPYTPEGELPVIQMGTKPRNRSGLPIIRLK